MLRLLIRAYLESRSLKRKRIDQDRIAYKDELTNYYKDNYENNINGLISELEHLFGKSSENRKLSQIAVKTFENKLSSSQIVWSSNGLRIGGLECHTELLVAVCSFYQELNILEVGVANGHSSALFHYLLSQNACHGTIHSIDQPTFEKDINLHASVRALAKQKIYDKLVNYTYQDANSRPDHMWRGGVVPDNRHCGWLIPTMLRLTQNSKLFIGNVFNILPELPNDFYNVILLDAMKDEKLRIQLMQETYDKARHGAIILQDGGWRNNAVAQFCAEKSLNHWDIGRISLIYVDKSNDISI